MDILKFLKQDSVKDLIAQGDLEAVYGMIPFDQRGDFSSYLLSKDVDVFEYLYDEVPARAFESVYNLKEAKLRQGVKKIRTAAFFNCRDLTEVSFPNSLEEIEDGCFIECRNLKDINFSDSITSIGASAFDGCTSLSGELKLPAKLKKLGKECFSGSYITKLVIPNTLTDIASAAFAYLKDLKEIEYLGTIAEYRASVIKAISPKRARQLTQVTCIDGEITGEAMSGLTPPSIPALRGAFCIRRADTADYITLGSFDRKSQEFSCVESRPNTYSNELHFLTKTSAETFLKNYPDHENFVIDQSTWTEAFYEIDTEYGPALATASYIYYRYARVKHVKDHLPQSVLTY